jgi:ubiquinone/menaquinone biosynthesis C-methylase UbiE
LYNLLLLTTALRPGSTVVDLACGPANLLVELAKLHPDANFIGVDLSPEMLRWAEQLKTSAGVGNVRFIEADITSIRQLEADSADLVMSTLSLHHLPDTGLLRQCFNEIARIVKPAGAVHLMDFASLKLEATARYFAYERTRGLGEFLAKDYAQSLRAAYRLADFQQLLPVLQTKVPAVRLHSTWGVPFLVAITSLGHGEPGATQRQQLGHYWTQMLPGQRADFDAMRSFFALGGLKACHPKRWGPAH